MRTSLNQAAAANHKFADRGDTTEPSTFAHSLTNRRAKLTQERRLAILQAARDILIEEGFGASSMSSIAARLGGSKGILYAYFSSKDALFADVVSTECERKIAVIFESEEPLGGGVLSTLREFGRRFVRLIFSEHSMQFTRMVIAESSRRPDLGALFTKRAHCRAVAGWRPTSNSRSPPVVFHPSTQSVWFSSSAASA